MAQDWVADGSIGQEWLGWISPTALCSLTSRGVRTNFVRVNVLPCHTARHFASFLLFAPLFFFFFHHLHPSSIFFSLIIPQGDSQELDKTTTSKQQPRSSNSIHLQQTTYIKTMRASILLSTLAMALVAQATSLTGLRTLVLLDTLDDADVYTDLWSDLEGNSFIAAQQELLLSLFVLAVVFHHLVASRLNHSSFSFLNERVCNGNIGRHFNLTINDVSSPVSLTKYDSRLYDHLIFLAPNMKGSWLNGVVSCCSSVVSSRTRLSTSR